MNQIGRAKTVLVFHGGGSGEAVISAVLAKTRPGRSDKRLRLTGSVGVAEDVMRHIEEDILSIVDHILEALEVPAPDFTLSYVNLGALSAGEMSLCVHGTSSDLPVFLSLLSASLGIALPGDVISTGHLASEADVRAVSSIPQKLQAAAADPSIRRFLCPSTNGDNSLDVLSPMEKQSIENAIIRHKAALEVLQVSDVFDLLRYVLDDESIVLGSLRNGYFDQCVSLESPCPVDRAAQFLARGNEKRFWDCLGMSLQTGHTDRARELLRSRIRYHSERHLYPADFGASLLQFVVSLPPHVRARRRLFPLISMRHCIEFSSYAGDSDMIDVKRLFDAVNGNGISRDRRARRWKGEHADKHGEASLDDVLSQISETALGDAVCRPIDAARLSFLVTDVATDSDRASFDVIEAFYAHLLRNCGGLSTGVSTEAIADGAHALLASAFSRDGGASAALLEMQEPVRGGARLVLDVMTDEFKRLESEKRIERVLSECIGRDWKTRLAFTHAFLRRFGVYLPPEIRAKGAEELAHRIESLIKLAVTSIESIGHSIRRF